MPNYLEISFRDYDNDKKTSGIRAATGATTPQKQAVHDAFVLWSAGGIGGTRDNIELVADGKAAAGTAVAQAVQRAVIELQDQTTLLVYREFLPMPDTAKADDVGTNKAWIAVGQGQKSLTVMNSAHADYSTLVSAIEALWISPAGNVGKVVRVYIEE